jgi:signal transduction histidine kinase
MLGALVLIYAGVLAGTGHNLSRSVRATLRLKSDNEALSRSLGTLSTELDFERQEKWRSLAQLSHELRTPLTAILGFSEAIRDELFGPLGDRRYRDYAGHVHSSGRHLLTLAGEILDISQSESGALLLSESEIDVAALIAGSAELLAVRAAAQQLRLASDVPHGFPLLWADETKIRQILLNLLTNAVKFTPPGGAVTVAAAQEPAGGIRISVSDTGVGMAERDIPRALEPFVRLANPLVRQTEGVGLGLSLCKRLAEMHGAELLIESAPGAGTTCTVRFPAERTRPAQAADAAAGG